MGGVRTEWYDPNIAGERWWEHRAYSFDDTCVDVGVRIGEEGYFDGHCLAMMEFYEPGMPCSQGLMVSVADDDITGFSTLINLNPDDNILLQGNSEGGQKYRDGHFGVAAQLAKERWIPRMLTQYAFGYPLDLGPLDVHHADVDGDTMEDIVGTTEGDNFKLGKVLIYLHEHRRTGQTTAAAALFGELETTPEDDVAAGIGRARYLKAPINVDNLEPRPARVVTADFDNDGDMDLAVAYQDSIWWYSNWEGDGKDWRREQLQGAAAYPTSLVAKDMEKDGDWDIVASFRDLGLIAVFTNQGARPPEEVAPGGTMTQEMKEAGAMPQGEAVDTVYDYSIFNYREANDEGYRVIGQLDYPTDLKIADIDLDNHWDVIAASASDTAGTTPEPCDARFRDCRTHYQGGAVYWYKNGGRTDSSGHIMSWSLKKLVMMANAPQHIEVLDINVDGFTDVIVLSEYGVVYYALNFMPTLGKWGDVRAFQPIDRLTGQLHDDFQFVHALTVGDSNKDGYMDVFVIADNAPLKLPDQGQKAMHGWALEYVNLGHTQEHDAEADPMENSVQHFDFYEVVGQFGGRVKRAKAGVMNCKHCPEGTYLKEGSRLSCRDCPAGSYSSQRGALNENTCHPCAAGRFSDAGSEFCKYCPCGTYSAVVGAPYCHSCPAGKFSVFTNQTNARVCEDCPAGYYSAAGACGCIPCSSGTYQDELGQRTCKACAEGKYNGFTAAKSIHDCQACPPGKYVESPAAGECTSCPGGTFNNQQGEVSIDACLDCPKRTYSREGSGRCTLCPGGTYNDEQRASGCSICEAGTASPGADTSCDSCGAGKYAGVGADICSNCPAGKYNELSLATSIDNCLDCSAGYYSAAGSGVCAMCPAGHYSSSNGTSECSACEPGKYLAALGANSGNLCESCPPGSWSAEGSFSCKVCPAGSYLQNVDGSGLTCSLCAAGLTSHRGSTQCVPPRELPNLEPNLNFGDDKSLGYGWALIIGMSMVGLLGLTYCGMACVKHFDKKSGHQRMHKIDLNDGRSFSRTSTL